MQISNLKISDLIPYKSNARTHPKKQIDLLAKNIERFGFTVPVLIDKDNVIIAGHGRILALKQLGKTEVPCVRMENLNEEEIKALRLADNQLGLMSDWDMNLVVSELKGLSMEMIDLTGFSKDLILENDEKDDVIPDNAPTVAKPGDIWQLGRHKVMCGDSTKSEDVEKLMNGMKADLIVTDPPYNTGMEAKPDDEKARLSHMFKDNFTEEEYAKLIKDSLCNCFNYSKGECAFYVFIDWRRGGQIKSAMETLMPVKNVIVWDKQVHGLGSDYKSTYELCVVGKKGKPQINNRYGLDYQDIWRLQRQMGRNKTHATAKPIELLEKPIIHASKQDDIILDLFLGSGSTLIASEKTNRICFGMELSEKYVDVIIKRWEDFTNQKAIKL